MKVKAHEFGTREAETLTFNQVCEGSSPFGLTREYIET